MHPETFEPMTFSSVHYFKDGERWLQDGTATVAKLLHITKD